MRAAALAYADLVRQIRLRLAFDTVASISRERLRILERSYAAGGSSRSEMLSARVDLNADRAALLRQDGTLLSSRAFLGYVLGRKAPVAGEVDTVFVPEDSPDLDPLLAGLESCAAFVADVLASYPQRHVGETIDEVHVSGDLAFDRGSFVTEVFDPELGRQVRECGTALRVYRRTPGGWKMARVMWHAEESDEDHGEPSPAA